jgi:hypothetical protein
MDYSITIPQTKFNSPLSSAKKIVQSPPKPFTNHQIEQNYTNANMPDAIIPKTNSLEKPPKKPKTDEDQLD